MTVRSVAVQKPGVVKDMAEKEQIDEVDRMAKRITVIDETMAGARKLAGTDGLVHEVDRLGKEVDRVTKEKEEAQDRERKANEEKLKAELGGKIDALTETIRSGGSSKDIAEQIGDFVKAAGALGLTRQGESGSNIKDTIALIQEMKPDVAAELEKLTKLQQMFKPTDDKKAPAAAMSEETALKLEEIKGQRELALEEMKDARQDRAQNFELKMLEFKTETDLRRAEIAGKVQTEREKNNMLAGAVEQLGEAIGRQVAKGGGMPMGEPSGPGANPPAGPIAETAADLPIIRAMVGEAGGVMCKACDGEMLLARDAESVLCPNCNQIHRVERITAK